MLEREPLHIGTAPRKADRPIQLYCPEQGGWHYGQWSRLDAPCWVAVIDPGIELHPTHWLPAEPPAMAHGEIITWIAQRGRVVAQ